jgi:hypothetical protein
MMTRLGGEVHSRPAGSDGGIRRCHRHVHVTAGARPTSYVSAQGADRQPRGGHPHGMSCPLCLPVAWGRQLGRIDRTGRCRSGRSPTTNRSVHDVDLASTACHKARCAYVRRCVLRCAGHSSINAVREGGDHERGRPLLGVHIHSLGDEGSRLAVRGWIVGLESPRVDLLRKSKWGNTVQELGAVGGRNIKVHRHV